MSNTVIRFDHVVKEYKLFKNGRQRLKSVFFRNTKHKIKRAVDNITFDVQKGESVAIFGRNGAGKSTVLKMITKVSYPNSGSIFVKGRVSALLELTSGFDPEFTGRENIYLKGSILGLTRSEIDSLEQIIIDFAEIHEYIDQPVRTYSSGMKSRLGFSINVNIHPEILIVDEALSVGDAAFKNKCAEKVDEIISNDNVTLLFVTHSSNIAKTFCKRGIVMDKGKIIYDGEIDDALAEYNSMFLKTKK
ncbi:MAG TPA: ABC transporter ATP-binding protein [Clostridia bacterium]|nr:ABC transporter ATP-binding protein [Clostridia bacterium]